MKLKFLLPLLLMSSGFIFSQEKTTGTGDKETVMPASTEISGNGKIENNVYTCYKFEWKIKIPENYVITPPPTANQSYLVGFEINNRNTFTSSFESLAGSKITSLEEHKNFIIKLYNETYSKIETLKFELSSSDMKIGKYDFYMVQTKLYDPKTNELLLTQDLYNCIIDNNLFSVNINYSYPGVGKLMTDTFISSLSN